MSTTPLPTPASLSIVHYPAQVLRVRCEEVPEVTNEVRQIAERMIELMTIARGIGLACPQVGLRWRMFVCDVPADEDALQTLDPKSGRHEFTQGPQVYINPVLRDAQGPVESMNEGCLSLPDIRGEVNRPRSITIDALDLNGNPVTLETTGLLARCIQHENDHLDGVLIIDRMTHLSKLRSKRAVRSLERAAGLR